MPRWGIKVTGFCFFRAGNKGVKEEKLTIKVDCCYDVSWNLGLKHVFFPVAPGYSSCPRYKGLRQAGSSLAVLFPSLLPTTPPCLDRLVHLLSFDSAACPPTRGPGQHSLVAPFLPSTFPTLAWSPGCPQADNGPGPQVRLTQPALPHASATVGSSCA